MSCKGTAQCQHLLFAAREKTRPTAQEGAKFGNQLQRHVYATTSQTEVLGGGQAPEDRSLLRYIGETLSTSLVEGLGRQVPVELNGPVRCRKHTLETFAVRLLPGSVGAEECDNLAREDVEIDIIEYGTFPYPDDALTARITGPGGVV